MGRKKFSPGARQDDNDEETWTSNRDFFHKNTQHNIHITYTSYYFIKSRPSLFIFSSVPTVFTFHVYLGCAITVLDLHCIFYSCAKRTSFSISIFSQHVVFLIRLQEPHKTYTIGYVRDNTSLGSNLRWYNPHPLQLHPLGMH